MPDATFSLSPVEHAQTVREAIGALDQLDPAHLAASPQDVYALLDHLTGVVRPDGDPVCALHIAAYRLQAEAPPHAMRLYGALDAAQHVLDPTSYRSNYGLGAGGAQ